MKNVYEMKKCESRVKIFVKEYSHKIVRNFQIFDRYEISKRISKRAIFHESVEPRRLSAGFRLGFRNASAKKERRRTEKLFVHPCGERAFAEILDRGVCSSVSRFRRSSRASHAFSMNLRRITFVSSRLIDQLKFATVRVD